MNESRGAIGVFDSGVGGLTVFREVAARIRRAPLMYLGDSARVPYGSKSPQTVSRYSMEAAEFLSARGISMLVIACNTATAMALEVLQDALEIPVVGVIGPGARAAVQVSAGKIGVIATEGTVKANAYRRAIHELDSSVEVTQVACPLFVPLVEEGWANTRVAREVAEIYLEPLLEEGIDTLLLGCTHYPLLRSTIEKVAAGRIQIVDSAETTAELVAAMTSEWIFDERENHFFVTDAEERFARIAGEFLESRCENLELVQLGG